MDNGNLGQWIKPVLLKQRVITKLQKEFTAGNPFRHILIADFLKQGKNELLLKELKKENFYRKEADLFKLSQTQELRYTKNKLLQSFYALFASAEFRDFIASMTGIKLKDSIDMSGALYQDTDYLLCHDDQLSGRKIAYIFYLSAGFTEKDGGALVFFRAKKRSSKLMPGDAAKQYTPKANSLMLFEVSPISFHEVAENVSNKNRYTIGGWLH